MLYATEHTHSYAYASNIPYTRYQAYVSVKFYSQFRTKRKKIHCALKATVDLITFNVFIQQQQQQQKHT